MAELFTVSDEFSGTISRYVSGKVALGRDPVAIMNRVMSYWLLNAMKSVKKADRGAVAARLMEKFGTGSKLPATRRKRAKVVNEMQNTRAAVLINMLDYGNARALRKAGDATGYFRLAKLWMMRRQFATGYHKSGFLEGLRVRRAPTDGSKPPRYTKYPTGESPAPTVTADWIRMEVTNMAGMIAELFPNAFEVGAMELTSRLTGLMMADMIKAQNTAGLNAK